jgi:very-short-patch-repair endonuclease
MRHTKDFMSLPYNPALKERARELRCAGNLSEVLLWNHLKNGQFDGLDFDRQKIIGNYIVDFYCAEKKIILEVDGSSHGTKEEYDAQRDAFLNGLGLNVIHIRDVDVKCRLSEVMSFLRSHPLFAPDPDSASDVSTTPLRQGKCVKIPPCPADTPTEEGNS